MPTPKPKPATLDSLAAEHGTRDARAALDSGDYGYHKTTKGLSTRQLVEDFWSFAKPKVFAKAKVDARSAAGARRAYGLAWAKVIDEAEHPAPVTSWKVENGRLDLRKLGRVPPEIEGLENVTTLSLYGMKLSQLAPVLFSLPNVEVAYLQNNKLTKAPAELQQWKRLRSLHLGGNPLVNADALADLSSLRALDLTGTKLKTLPEAISALSRLEVLDLFQAKASWKHWPESFAKLQSLKVVRAPLDRREVILTALRSARINAKVVTGGAVMP